MSIFPAFLAAFFAGSVPTAYLFVKAIKRTDIRLHGSGNVGATNAARVLGKKMGLLIFLIDFLKGFLPAVILARVLDGSSSLSYSELAEFIGFGAILGHIFTPFLKGKGGKGIATGAGVICAGYPLILSLMLLIWIIVFFMSRRTVSVGSIVSVASYIPFTILFKTPPGVILFSAVLFILTLWTHRSNIARLFRGEEI